MRSRPLAIGGTASSARVRGLQRSVGAGDASRPRHVRWIRHGAVGGGAKMVSQGRRSAPAVGNGPPGSRPGAMPSTTPEPRPSAWASRIRPDFLFSDWAFSWSGARPFSSRLYSTNPRGRAQLVSRWGDAAERERRDPWGSVPLHRHGCGGPTDYRPGPAGRADRPGAGLIHRSAPRRPALTASLVASKLTDMRRNPPRAALTGALGRPQLESLFPRSRLTSSTGDDAIRGPPMQPARSTSSTPRNDGASPRLAAASRPGRTQPEPVSRENAGGSIDEPWTLLPVGPVVEDRILAQQGSELAGAFRVSRRATHRTAISRQVVVPQPHRRPERNVAESSAHSAAQSRTISAVP